MENEKNFSCFYALQWSTEAKTRRLPGFYICLFALCFHALFWLEIVFFSNLRQRSLQWIYAYLITDFLIILRVLFLYTVRTTSPECFPSQAWFWFVCHIDVFSDFHLNVVQVYIFLALNFSRYIQIRHNKNVYVDYPKSIVFVHWIIYTAPIFSFIMQNRLLLTEIFVIPHDSCDIRYKTVVIRAVNLFLSFVLPILLNLIIIVLSARHIRSATRHTTTQQGNQQFLARQRYNRSIFIQFLVFYLVWLCLWSPNLIIYQTFYNNPALTQIGRLLNFIEVSLDPLIIVALDTRLLQVWRKIFDYFKRKCRHDRVFPERDAPNAFDHHIATIQQHRTI